MVFVTHLKNPKKVIQALAKEPMDKWKLKGKTGLAYPRVHEVIKRIEKSGYVTVFSKKKSERGLTIKVFSLTFKGVLAYVTSVSLVPPPVLGWLNENPEEFKKRHRHENKRYWKKMEQFVEFLEFYGKLLDYPIFKEIRWLTKNYGKPYICSVIIGVARLIERLSISPTGASQMIKELKKQIRKLEKERKVYENNPWLRKMSMYATIDGKEEEKEEWEVDILRQTNNRIKSVERNLQATLNYERNWLQKHFAELFLGRIIYTTPEKSTTLNEELYKLSKELLDRKLNREIIPLKKAVALFGGNKG